MKDENNKSRNWNLFERPTEPPAYRLQPRDTRIIEAVFRHRFLTPSHLYTLLGGSKPNIANRCRLLWQDAYLERPKALRPTKILTEEIVYSLGKKGAQLLEGLRRKGEMFLDYLKPETDIGELDWGDSPKKQIGWPYIDHQLGIASFMVCLQKASEEKGVVLHWDGHFNRRSYVIRLPKIGDREACSFLPDAYFTLEVPGKGFARHYLEFDRGNVSLSRMKERYTHYFDYWYLLQKQGKKTQFRVLTISDDPGYMDSLRRAAESIGRSSKYPHTWKALLFTNTKNFSLENYCNTLEPIWYYADESDPIRLV
ncbi:hypothetical protein C0389_04840 [bacterium]|nr:hypothetical protein [bacterium]